MSEQPLTDQVASALEREPRVTLTWRPLRISAERGDVVLEGEVEDVAAKKLALERTARVPGVERIIDRLHVGSTVTLPDDELLARICSALRAEPTLQLHRLIPRRLDPGELPGLEQSEPGFISVSVENGVVTLDGTVDSLRNKRLAGSVVWALAGVHDVVNGLGVEPPEEDSDDAVTVAVEGALERDPLLSDTDLRVQTKNAVVRLTGWVDSEDQSRAAERDAWCVFGVDRVENELSTRILH